MIWVDREVKKILERNKQLEWVDDMKTPSGRIHVGSLRGVVIHDLVYRALLENDKDTKFTYVIEDHDPMDAIPSYLDYDKWEQYAGKQLFKIPSPEPGFSSFGEFYGKEFISVFESINCHPEIIWMSEVYKSGKMNEVVRNALDKVGQIREIYLRITKVKKADDWFPLNVVCEKCGRVGTTSVHKWDGEFVYYKCNPEMVAWAEGCGNEGKVSPFNGNAKMPWRVEWPAKWKVNGVLVEGAGK
ncbi:MAG: lysine--tRNA ligase, partial [Patescibacteria group bacterium]